MSQKSHRVGSVLVGVVGGIGFSVLAGVLVAAMATPLVSVAGATVNNSVGIFDSLPDEIAIDQQPQQNRIFASSNGAPVQIATMFDQNREEVGWEEVSDFVKNAAVSGEDRRFYEHGGVDPAGIARAAVANLAAGGIAEGASTITQQYVKNTFVQAALELPEDEQAAAYNAAIDTSFARKLEEMKFAISLEKQYTKEEILLAYLNIANFGGTTYGIEAAAQRYYNTTALNLTAAQAASLVAIVQSPTAMRLDNSENWQRNTDRRNVILGAMLSDGNLTPEQHSEAVAVVADATTVTLTEPSNGCRVANDYSRYFCDYIINLIPELESLGADAAERAASWRHGGYDVYTTLEMGLQIPAQDAVWANAPNDTTRLQLGAAAVSVEVGTGRILTMAQNKTYDNTGDADPSTTAVNFNTDRAYGGSSGFQPGSTYKVFTLLNWLENGRSINEVVNGSPRTIPQNQFTNSCDPSQVVGVPYQFGNDDGFGGNMTVATGVQRSVNGAFMSMALDLDLCEIKETAESIGVHRADGGELGMTPASVLGTNEIAPLTMATAYAAIANQGVYCTSVAVDRIVGPDGAELPGQPRNCSEQLSTDVANTAAYAMSAVMVGGGTATRSNPNNGVEYIGKTGTTDSSNQTWVVGASTRAATAVWVGNIEGEYPMRTYRNDQGVQGGVIRHDIFRPIATAIDATPNYRGGDFPSPAARLTTTPRVSVAPEATTPPTPTPTAPAPQAPGATTPQTPPSQQGQGPGQGQGPQNPVPSVPNSELPD